MIHLMYKRKRDDLYAGIQMMSFDALINNLYVECQNTTFLIDDSAKLLTSEEAKNNTIKKIDKLSKDKKFKHLYENVYAFNIDSETFKTKLKEEIKIGVNTILKMNKKKAETNVIYFVCDLDYKMDILLCNNEENKFDDYHSYHVLGKIICEIDDYINYDEWFAPIQQYLDFNYDILADSNDFDVMYKTYKYNFFYYFGEILSELDMGKVLPKGFRFYVSDFDSNSFMVYRNNNQD